MVRAAIGDKSGNGATEILLYIWQYMAPTAIASAAFTLVIVDGINGLMVLSTWLAETLEKRRRKEEERRRREMERIRLEGKAAAESARIEATLEVQNRWEDWNRRREAAESTGEKFSEPPPGTNQETENPQRN